MVKNMIMKKTKTFSALLLGMILFMTSCESPEDNISAPTYALIGIAAQFADESISTQQFTPKQQPPFGDTSFHVPSPPVHLHRSTSVT